MGKKKKGEGIPVFEYHLGNGKYVQTDIYGKPIHAVVHGQPADPTREDLLSAQEQVELRNQVESDRRTYFDAKYHHLQETDPRFEKVLRRMQTGLHPEDAAIVNVDPEAFVETYDKVRGKVGRSDEEWEEIASRQERAEQAQEEYLSGKAGLDALAELMDIRGTAKAIQPVQPEEAEEDENQKFYDESAADAIRDRNEYRRETLEEKARTRKGLTDAEIEEILALRDQRPADNPEDGDDE